MKKSNSIIRHLTVLLAGAALALTSACSSSQQDEEDLEMSNEEGNQQGNLGEDDAAEGNGQENFENGNEGEEGNNEQGAEVNSDTDDEFGDQAFAQGNGENSNPTLDNSAGGNQAAMQTAAPMNAAPMNPAPMNQAAAPVAPAPVASEKSPVPGGRVRYVREGGVQVVNAPGGSPVFSLETGDHPVTWEENGWLRISNGMYVPVDAMSTKGVPRGKTGGGWN